MRIFHEKIFLPMLIPSKHISFRLFYSQTISLVGDNYCKCLFYCPIVVWQEKTLLFQTLPSLISNVWRLPAGCQRNATPEDVFVGYVYWTVRLFLAVAFSITVHLMFLKKQTQKKILKFFTPPLPLLALSLPPTIHACTHTHTSPKPLPPYPPPSDPSDFLPVGAVRDSSSLRSGNETSKQ